MRTVYAKILAWSLATLLISMGLFTLINRQIETRRTGNLFSRFLKLELELARGAYETGGQREAADYIVRLDRVMVDLSPKLRQTVKAHFSSNGELSHGSRTKEVHERV